VIDPKYGIRNFDESKIHLRVGFMWKNQLKCIGTTIITPSSTSAMALDFSHKKGNHV